MNLAINVGDLHEGVHFYNVRIQDANGTWGTIQRMLFVVPTAKIPSNASQLVKYEYWIDNDYASRVTVNATDEEQTPSQSIDVSNLSAGIHFYSVRAQNANGVWGTVTRYIFYVPQTKQEQNGMLIAGYRYAFNDEWSEVMLPEPVEQYEVNSAIEMPRQQPSTVINDSCHFLFNDSVTMMTRHETLAFTMAFRDQNGNYGVPFAESVTVADTVLVQNQVLTNATPVTFPAQTDADFSVARLDVVKNATISLKASSPCYLHLYNQDGVLLAKCDTAATMDAYSYEYEPGVYYVVVYGNQGEMMLTAEGESTLPEPYAVLSDNNTVLTFYYDNQKEERGGMDVGPFTSSNDRGWHNSADSIKLAVFDESMESCKTITSIAFWFYGLHSLATIQGIQYLNTENVTDMSDVFPNCFNLTNLDLSGFNTSNVTNMRGMFGCNYALTSLDLSSFNTAKVTNMSGMFFACTKLHNLDLSNFNTENVTQMQQMFQDCKGLQRIDLSSFNTANVWYMGSMFTRCWNLRKIFVGKEWNTASVTAGGGMFDECTQLVGGAGTVFDADHIDYTYARIDGGTDNPGYLTERDPNSLGVIEPYVVLADNDTVIETSDNGTATYGKTLSFYYDENMGRRDGMYIDSFDWNSYEEGKIWDNQLNKITTVRFDNSFANYTALTSTAFWFMNCNKLTEIEGMGNLNTQNVTSMEYMFTGCQTILSLDLSNFDTRNVTSMEAMFYGCPNLTTIYAGSEWNIASVTSSNSMFTGCTSLVGGKGTTYAPSHIDHTYAHIDGGTANPGYFTDKNAPVPADAEPYAVLSDNNTVLTFYYDGNKEQMNGMSVGPFTSEYDRAWRSVRSQIRSVVFDASFSNCTTITSTVIWFDELVNLTSIVGINNLHTDSVTNMGSMFRRCERLTDLDVSGFDTRKVTNMSYMFENCYAVTLLDVSNFNTENVTDMRNMFSGCSHLESLDVSGFNTSNVTTMYHMFSNCSALTNLDVSHFNTSKVTTMVSMFGACSKLTNIDVTNFDVKNVENMEGMFGSCSSLTRIDLSNLNTEKVKYMDYLFQGCTALTTPVIENLNTTAVTSMTGMFKDCSSLTSLDLSKWNTNRLTSTNNMFSGCTNLANLDIRTFTSRVSFTYEMFKNCTSLTELDLGNFYTKSAQSMFSMFEGCNNLKTIYVGDDWGTDAAKSYGNSMFLGCTSIVGGAGTVYDANHTDYTYAHIDGGPSNPGYLTAKNAPAVDATFDSNGVLTVGGSTTMADALEYAGGRAEVAKTITAVVWNSTAMLTNTDLQGLDNPNLLVYVNDAALAPQGVQNVVVDGVAKEIVLTDVEEGNNNFYCPQAFTAETISYSRTFQQHTQIGVCRGWETIALPFTVQSVTHADKGAIAPFGNDASDKHFWLRHLDGNGLASAQRIEAYVPYIISMPNSDEYTADYNLNGLVTFSAQNATVRKTEPVAAAYNDSSIVMMPAMQRQDRSSDVWAINVGESRSTYLEGSAFERDYRVVRPFEAYTVHRGNGAAPRFVPIVDMADGDVTGIGDLTSALSKGEGAWYDLSGRKLQRKPSQKGVYLYNGRQVVIR